MTLEAFLDWESRQEFKHEFDGFHPVANTGVTAARAPIQFNLVGLLLNRLRGHRCQAYGGDLKIQVVARIRYPDAFIVRSPVPPGTTMIHDPVVVFEILSPGTSYKDRVEKNNEYRDTLSIQRYVILERSQPPATVFSHAANDWVGHIVSGETDLALPEIETTLPLTDLYEGVTFPPTPDEMQAG
jgi:Uma2 family endonuclease